jgi:MFS family permease
VGGCALVRDQPAGSRALKSLRGVAGIANARLSLGDLLDVPRPRAFLTFLGFTLLMSILTTQLFSTMSVYAMTRLAIPERRFGLLYSVNGIMVVALQGPAVRFISRVGIRRALIIGPLIYAAGYMAVGVSTSFASLAVAVALVTIGELLTEPSEMCAAVALGDPARPGRAMGIFGLISSLGNSLGPGVGGVLYDHTRARPLALWWTIAGLGVIGSAGYNAIGPIDDEPVGAKAASG